MGIGIPLLAKSLGINWEACHKMASDHWLMLWNNLQEVKCVELLCEFAEVSGLLLVLMLWSAAICMTLKGRDII